MPSDSTASSTTSSHNKEKHDKLPPYIELCLKTQDLFAAIQDECKQSYYPVLDEWNSEDLFSLLYTLKTKKQQ